MRLSSNAIYRVSEFDEFSHNKSYNLYNRIKIGEIFQKVLKKIHHSMNNEYGGEHSASLFKPLHSTRTCQTESEI